MAKEYLKATNLARAIWRLVGKCEYPECRSRVSKPQLQGAHIFGVGAFPRLRDDLRNGLSLCSVDHRYFTDNPIAFTDWIRTTKYAVYLEPLMEKNQAFEKRFWAERLTELTDIKKRIEEGELTIDEARQYEIK